MRAKARVGVSFTATAAVNDPGDRSSRSESPRSRVRKWSTKRALVWQAQQKIQRGPLRYRKTSDITNFVPFLPRNRVGFCTNPFTRAPASLPDCNQMKSTNWSFWTFLSRNRRANQKSPKITRRTTSHNPPIRSRPDTRRGKPQRQMRVFSRR
jgi:hypothetical protein